MKVFIIYYYTIIYDYTVICDYITETLYLIIKLGELITYD